MKYAVEMVSGDMIYISILYRRDTQTHRHIDSMEIA
jgi:hypothetical protein